MDKSFLKSLSCSAALHATTMFAGLALVAFGVRCIHTPPATARHVLLDLADAPPALPPPETPAVPRTPLAAIAPPRLSAPAAQTPAFPAVAARLLLPEARPLRLPGGNTQPTLGHWDIASARAAARLRAGYGAGGTEIIATGSGGTMGPGEGGGQGEESNAASAGSGEVAGTTESVASAGAEVVELPARPHADNPRPVYPDVAKRMGLEGVVRLRIHVLADGRVREVSLAASSGHELLDAEALRVFRQWRYEPALRNGLAVESELTQPVPFRLVR